MLAKVLNREVGHQVNPLRFSHLSARILSHWFSINNYMKTFTAGQVSRHHGRTRVDENSNLFSNPQKLEQFIQKQTESFTRYSQKWEARTKSYLQIVNSRRDERTQSTSQIYNDYKYYTSAAWHEGREYTQVWRTHLSRGKPQLVLDIMQYSSIRKYYKTVDLVKTVLSQCGNYIAFGVDLHNNEEVCFMIKNIAKNHLIGIQGWEQSKMKGVDNLVFSGSNSIFYTKVINFRPAQIWYQNLATGEAYMVFEEKNGQYYLDIFMAKNNRHIIINSSSKDNSKIYTIDTSVPIGQNKYAVSQVLVSKAGTKTYVNHNGSHFVIWKDSPEANQIILKDSSGKEKVIHRIDPDQAEAIGDIDVFDKYIVLYIRKIVSPVIRIIELSQLNDSVNISDLALPYQFGSVHPGANQMFKTSTFLFYLNNIFVYNQGYEYNFETKQISMKEPFKMTGPRFNPKDYEVILHEVPAEDGQLVPLTTVVPKRNSKKRNKMLLHCYGYYGLSYQISFNNTYWAALESGWSLAYAHVRGGGEKGTSWHKQAIKGQRYKNWSDLEDCVAYLIKNEFTHPNVLILTSHSAGSITIWSIINRYPHLFKAVVMNYPFLDVLGLLLDSSKPLTQSDYPEFGNPCESLQAYNQIESYSPYDNIEDKKYPFIYLVAGTKDYRCPIEQIAKFSKRYRQIRKFETEKERFEQIGEKGLLVKINEGSHEGLADLGDQLRDGCEMLACMDFLIEEASQDVTVDK